MMKLPTQREEDMNTITRDPEPVSSYLTCEPANQPVTQEILVEFEGIEEFPAHNLATVSECILDLEIDT